MAVCKSAIERKTPRRMRWRVIFEKKFSTALSQEAEVGVKWKVQRGCRASQASTRGCLCVASLSSTAWITLPAGTSRSTEKADEFAVAVALHAAADHGAVEHTECGEQGGSAVPLVIMRHGVAAPGLDG